MRIKQITDKIKRHFIQYIDILLNKPKALYTAEEIEKDKKYQFSNNVKFSVIVPLYNTPEVYLKEMIESVLNQTYANWELCLADGSDSQHYKVGEICANYINKETRIKYKHLDENKGISSNTNACIALASGDYLVMLDHDDVLNPTALFKVMQAIETEGADFIYTDEAKFEFDPKMCFSPNYKPDFSKDELRAHNYICHLLVYKRSFIDKIGLYRSECDGSQDHDMVLRITETAERIVHIPEILYFWRVHEGSVSASVETKSYAVDSAHRAIRDQLNRLEEYGEVTSIEPFPSLYRTVYQISSYPQISVIVYGESSEEDYMSCIRAIEDNTFYYPVELCLIECEGWRFTKYITEYLPTIKPVNIIYRNDLPPDCNELMLALEKCEGDFIAFVNSNTVINSKDWIKELLMYAQRKDVGVVGGKILDGKGMIYSGGISVDSNNKGFIHHMHRGENELSYGYEAHLWHARNVVALDKAFVMINKEKLFEIGGLDTAAGELSMVDLCIRLYKAGFLNIWTPFVSAIYNGSTKCSGETIKKLTKKYHNITDPYYNKNVRKYNLY